MNLGTILEEIITRVEGAVYAACVGSDGIALSQNIKEASFDPAVCDAEIANVIGVILRASEGIEGGELNEIFFTTEKYTILVRPVDKEVFFVLVLSGAIQNLGLARLESKKIIPKIKEILS
jgi:predicted regulator of Ras-like GTPase activity (Roadblock/LC7/MglB family)